MSIFNEEDWILKQIDAATEEFKRKKEDCVNEGKRIITYLSRQIKGMVILGEIPEEDSIIQQSHIWSSNEHINDSVWYYWDREIRASVRKFINEYPKRYKKLIPAVIKAKATIDETLSDAGLDYKCIWGDDVKISINCKSVSVNNIANIRCSYSKLETALPSILETLCLLDELLVATRCTTVSNR